ncbi:MAG: YihY/virulence factor BrkB family protein, partial [Paludibacteraceae bacterium]|nr:YihY/virulence factor BrkB family protein [Paludibacteraceae bacterium]
TYSLLFAIVPILAMVFAIAKGFGFSDLIEQKLLETPIGQSEFLPTIMEFVERYLDTSAEGLFLGIGIIILISAAYTFFRSIETSFNEIWNVKQSRSIMRQIVTYIAILFLIPVLIIVTIGLNIYLHSAAETWEFFSFLNRFRDGGLNFMQFVMATVVFTWMYIAIPNTKVRFMSGLIPGLITACLLMAIEALSVYIVAYLSRTSIVYGAFAFIPILLIIVKWISLIILIGAEMSYAIQNNELFAFEYDLEKMSRRYKDFLTLSLLSEIVKRFENDETPLTARELALSNAIPVRQATLLLSRLTEVGILREVYIEGKEDRTYQPALDTHKITIGMVFDRIDAQGTEDFLETSTKHRQQLWKRFLQLRQDERHAREIYVNEL